VRASSRASFAPQAFAGGSVKALSTIMGDRGDNAYLACMAGDQPSLSAIA
jgi:hypothetical protein